MALKGTRVTQQEKMWQLYQDGNSFVKIKKKLHRCPDTVSRYVHEHEAAVGVDSVVMNVNKIKIRNEDLP